jgi:hypothetical protein
MQDRAIGPMIAVAGGGGRFGNFAWSALHPTSPLLAPGDYDG